MPTTPLQFVLRIAGLYAKANPIIYFGLANLRRRLAAEWVLSVIGPFAFGKRKEAVCFRGSSPGGDGGNANWIVRISASPGISDLAVAPGRYFIPGGAMGGKNKVFLPSLVVSHLRAASETVWDRRVPCRFAGGGSGGYGSPASRNVPERGALSVATMREQRRPTDSTGCVRCGKAGNARPAMSSRPRGNLALNVPALCPSNIT